MVTATQHRLKEHEYNERVIEYHKQQEATIFDIIRIKGNTRKENVELMIDHRFLMYFIEHEDEVLRSFAKKQLSIYITSQEMMVDSVNDFKWVGREW